MVPDSLTSCWGAGKVTLRNPSLQIYSLSGHALGVAVDTSAFVLRRWHYCGAADSNLTRCQMLITGNL